MDASSTFYLVLTLVWKVKYVDLVMSKLLYRFEWYSNVCRVVELNRYPL